MKRELRHLDIFNEAINKVNRSILLSVTDTNEILKSYYK